MGHGSSIVLPVVLCSRVTAWIPVGSCCPGPSPREINFAVERSNKQYFKFFSLNKIFDNQIIVSDPVFLGVVKKFCRYIRSAFPVSALDFVVSNMCSNIPNRRRQIGLIYQREYPRKPESFPENLQKQISFKRI